jgi:signal transduction histidine kinase
LRKALLFKLLAVNLPILVGAMGVVWLAIDYLAADYFSALMTQYNISPSDTHAMFVDAVHRYLIQASIVAIALAVLLSFLLTRMVLRPLAAMQRATRRLAAGDYTARVPVETRDELGDLAQAFNSMAAGLERGERLRRSMVADIAHELRTPLTNVRGYLEGMADGVVAPSKPTLDMLQAEIMRLVRLVDDLHHLTLADAARGNLQDAPVDLGALVNEVVAFERGALDGRGVALDVDMPDALPALRADRDKLRQVLRNLIQNAHQYAPDGGTVRIDGERRGENIRLGVGNDGPGIPEGDLPYIFERFYRADKSRSRDSGGAGIGLAIVKGLVEAHGGRVGAESRPGWTRIWVELPPEPRAGSRSLSNL